MDEKLFAEGERDFKFFIVKSGEVEIVDHSPGRDEIVTVHEPREFTGDVDMLTGRPVLVSAIARTPCEAYEISAGDLRRILNEIPQIAESWPLRRISAGDQPSWHFCCGRRAVGSTKRVASAVGEGAMAVQFVHEYLASN